MYDPATALPDIYLREEGNLDPHKNPDTSFTIVLFVIAQNWQQPGSDHNGWMVRQTVEHSHHGTPSSNNQGTVDTCNNLDKSPRHHVEGKISTIPYHMLSRTWYLWNDMIRQMESRLLVAGGGAAKVGRGEVFAVRAILRPELYTRTSFRVLRSYHSCARCRQCGKLEKQIMNKTWQTTVSVKTNEPIY